MGCWFSHAWEVKGPIGYGTKGWIAWCSCVRCGTSRYRWLDGKELRRQW